MHVTVEIKPGPDVDATTIGIWDVEGGSKGISLFYAIQPDGKRLYHDIARPTGEPH